MANKKNNSISDNAVKNASGGYVDGYASYYKVFDNDTGKEVKRFEGYSDDVRSNAFEYNEAYHKGKNAGQQIGFKKGYDAAKKVIDVSGKL